MEKDDLSILFLLSLPILLAISNLFIRFNALDIIYLGLVVVIFGKYYLKTKIQK